MRHNRLVHSLGVILLISAALLATVLPAGALGPAYVYSVACTSAVTITTTTETVLCTLPGVTTSPGEVIRLVALADITSGTGTTAITVRFHRGLTVGGTLVGPQDAVQTTAGNTIARSAEAEDSPGEVVGLPYVLTAQQTAATGNGSGLFSELMAIVF